MKKLWRYFNVLRTIIIKEMTFYKRYPFRIIGELSNPLLMVLPIMLFGKAFYDSNSGFQSYTGITDYRAFFLVSAVFWQYLNSTFWGVGFWLREEMSQGTLEDNWVSPTSPFILMLGRSMANFMTTTISAILLVIIFTAIYDFDINFAWKGGILVILLAIVAVYGIGIIFAGLVIKLKNPNAIANVMRFSFFILCGVFYPINVLPAGLRFFSYLLPITYTVDLLRGVMLGTQMIFPLVLEICVVVGFAIFTMVFAYLFFKWIERRTKAAGSLGHY